MLPQKRKLASNTRNKLLQVPVWRLNPVIIALVALATYACSRLAFKYYVFDEAVFGHYRRPYLDDGPGEPWFPTDERPIPLAEFPRLRESSREDGGTRTTLLFLHLWKCAGSSLRHLLRDWAALVDRQMAIVVSCNDVEARATGRGVSTFCPGVCARY